MTSEDGLSQVRRLLLNPPSGERRSASELREALTELYDLWLSRHAARFGVTPDSGIALVAVGGLGRKEMHPHSDLDLVLVHAPGVDTSAIAEKIWYPVWDAGIGLDHSVRTVDEAIAVAGTDLRTALGLLEIRYLAGDRALADQLASEARKFWRVNIRKRFDELADSVAKRHAESGEIAQRAEPDIKNGRGGLRDVHMLNALAAAQLVDRPRREVLAANENLLNVRTQLHVTAGRARDVVRAQDGMEIAGALGLSDRYELAQSLSASGRTIAYALDVALRTARAALPKRGWRRSAPVRRPLAEGVVLHENEVTLAQAADPRRDPVLLLRVASSAARIDMPISASTLTRLADSIPELRYPWPPAALDELLALLGSGSGLVNVVEALDRTGLWGRLFPEWGAVRDLPPRSPEHTWTVDRHLVQTVVQAARLATTVSRPDLLLLSALVHDIGKGRTEDHSVLGEKIAVEIGRRVGLSERDTHTVGALVRHHLLLPATATRRDVEDARTIDRVTATVDNDPIVLELLQALTEADSRATGPGVWNSFKAELVAELVYRCTAVMAGERMPAPEPLSAEQLVLANRVAHTGKLDLLVQEDSVATRVTVLADDRPGLLSRTAGVLALNSLEVHAANVRNHGSVAVDVFTVSPKFGRLPDPILLREQLQRALDGGLELPERIAAKERDYAWKEVDVAPPRLRWFDDEASGAVVLELRAGDRIGLLYRVTSVLEGLEMDIQWARVSTLGGSAVDSFSIVDRHGGVPSPVTRSQIERAVLSAITSR